MPKTIRPKDEVRVRRDIYRIREEERDRFLYAAAGEVGVVLEIFRPQPTGFGEVKPLAAKVLIEERVKTFRLTSLELVESPKKGGKRVRVRNPAGLR